MDPFSLLAMFLLVGMAASLDRSDEAEARRTAILGPRSRFPHDDDRLLFDLLVQRYRKTGDIEGYDTTSWLYEQARANRIPGEVVSKVGSAVRSAIREDRLNRWEFRAVPQARRHHWIRTHDGLDVHLARLVYVDLTALYQREGRAGLDRYNAMRDYLEKWAGILEIQFDEQTNEFWAWVPTPDNKWHAMGLRQWNTIPRKWPDFVDPEVIRHRYPPRPKMADRE